MKKRTIGILATSVAVGALCVVTDTFAIARDGGLGGFHPGGGGSHPAVGAFHPGAGGFHPAFGSFHGFAVHGGTARFGHGWNVGHALSVHRFSAHAWHTHGLTSHVISSHRGYRGYRYSGHNALAHNQPGGINQASRSEFVHGQPTREQFTHNQFAAQNFHGLNAFNQTGFNRNAFGSSAEWNHWGGRFWGAGWNNWGWGWGGWAGPVFWPFLFGDVFSFIFWPYAYYDPFWAFGPWFIFASIFAPGPYFGPEYGYWPDYYAYGYGPDYYGYAGLPDIYYDSYRGRRRHVTRAVRKVLAETNTAALESCSGLAPGVTNLPIKQIRQSVHLTADQQAALGDLNAASLQASDIIKSSCPATVPLTPIGRLDAAGQRLEATIKAIQAIRSPLESFYDSLSDEQKVRFNAMSGSTEGARSADHLTALCNQQSAGVINLPVQRIEQVVQPTTQQQSAFDNLKKTTQNAADQLRASCPTAVPQSPMARLDTIETRLKAMADAIKSVRPDLKTFYASLSDEQKARFNTMGPQPNAASSQPQSRSGRE